MATTDPMRPLSQDSDDDDASLNRGSTEGLHPETVDREFGWRGWVLVGAIFLAFLVIPGILILYPQVGPLLGLGYRNTYLLLPLIPAVTLGLLAVWATTRP